MSASAQSMATDTALTCAEQIRITGTVQGVGFRPFVWRVANRHGVTGTVINDGDEVRIQAYGHADDLDRFSAELKNQPPPLARVERIERSTLKPTDKPTQFTIEPSDAGNHRSHITADAAVCAQCLAEIRDPLNRRYRYALTNCTHCGPRFSIVHAIPYDRRHTSMQAFAQCGDCLSEYENPADRRFHAQPNACYQCGPEVVLQRLDGKPVCLESLTQLDVIDAACTVLQNGEILAVKGIGGFHLACDATNAEAVARLRQAKQRYGKPFALMARDAEVIQRYAKASPQELALLSSAEAPIVLLQKSDAPPPGTQRQFGVAEGSRAKDLLPVCEAVAPGQSTLGFMLPYTPLHHLMLTRMNRPVVFTSGNLSDEPQAIDNAEAIERLASLADFVLLHNRDILNRIDDSVVRMMAGEARILRRARGYAPTPLTLPAGFATVPPVLAMGAELKNTFCLLHDGKAIVSQHIGDLENAPTYADYQHNLALYAKLFEHDAETIAVDAHPEYLSSKLGRQWAEEQGRHCEAVQHHHAHIAACMAENGLPLDSEPVLGVALDGLGFGEDGTIWGGEFLLADYFKAQRVGCFKPVAMLGGTQAIREPWRNTYAHLMAEMGWPELKMNFGELELLGFLEAQPLDTYQAMLKSGNNAPLASSCGRLFDAVAAAIGLCREQAIYEGQAAIELEAIVDTDTLHHEDEQLAYPFAIPRLHRPGHVSDQLPYIEPLAMWQALLGDLILQTPPAVMSARFHKGLAKAIVTMIDKLCTRNDERHTHIVALSGGVFQNKTLFEQVLKRLEQKAFTVLTHRQLPANDGGIALGQAVVAAARLRPSQQAT